MAIAVLYVDYDRHDAITSYVDLLNTAKTIVSREGDQSLSQTTIKTTRVDAGIMTLVGPLSWLGDSS